MMELEIAGLIAGAALALMAIREAYRMGKDSGRSLILSALQSDVASEAAARAMCNANMGGADVWASGAVNRESRIIEARIALMAAADKIAEEP